MEKFWSWSAHDLANSVQTRQVSAVEVAENSLARLQAINPMLNAVIEHNDRWTLQQAAEIDRRLSAGEHLPLAGVPVTIKDNLWVEGRRITQGSRLFEHFIAPESAWPVLRIQAMGAVLIGITNCSEFACKGVSNNLPHGKTRSPWNLALTPGGSSGGAVSATAAGIGALAMATDAGGSTRRPAAHCGLVGMKPTFGLIPCGPGFDEPNFGLSVIGQIARDVRDASLMFDSLRGFSAADWGSQPVDMVRISAVLGEAPSRQLRIAFSHDLGCDFAIDTGVRLRLEQAVARLAGDGYRIEQAAPIWPAGVREYPLLKLQQAGLAALHGDAFDEDASRIDPDLQAQIRLGRGYSGVEIAEVLLLREQIYAACAKFFQSYDLLLCPTTPVVSWPLDQLGPTMIGGKAAGPRGHAGYTPLFNYCQSPACSVPVGLVDQLPVGLQIVGARYADPLVLKMAAHLERLLGPQPRAPLWDQ